MRWNPIRVWLVLAVVGSGSLTAAHPPAGERYHDFIAAAGNAESDAVRLGHLRKLAQQCAADGTTLPGLDALLAFIERWESPVSRLQFFDDQVSKKPEYDFGIDEESLLFPIAAFYRGRMLVWTCLEHGTIYPFPEKRALYLGLARRDFQIAVRAFPENRIIRMYLGEVIPPAKNFPVPAGAPAWAAAQREGLERLTDIIEWWIDHRMRPNGEYGGGWGDDCEIWRSWVPILFGFEHPRVNWAQGYFSSRLLAQPHLAGGYHSRLHDVEHSAEDTADALAPMMFLAPDNPEWTRRVSRIVDLAENLWMGTNARGQLQFKSTYFTSEQVDLTPARACDTVYHPRALQPALLYWQRTGDARIGTLVMSWMRTWVAAAARAERGKPAGMLPTAIHWPDGAVGGVGEKWWEPGNYSSPLYDFPSAMSLMLNTLVQTAHLTGDAAYLAPLHSMTAARLDWMAAGRPDAAPGSRMWCAARLESLGGAVSKYRFVTGDTSFDALLRAELEVPYVQFRVGGKAQGKARLAKALEEAAASLRGNFPGFTQEVRYTDRTMRFPALFQSGWLTEPGAATQSAESTALATAKRLTLLHHSATGEVGDALYFPLNAVRWKTPPRDIAALVTEASARAFEAELYHFGENARQLGVEFFRLEPGNYRAVLTNLTTGGMEMETTFIITAGKRTVEISLPPRVECRLVVRGI